MGKEECGAAGVEGWIRGDSRPKTPRVSVLEKEGSYLHVWERPSPPFPPAQKDPLGLFPRGARF